MQNVVLGNFGEEYSANLLIIKGHKIIARNFKAKVGEVDIISEYNNCLFLTEVKTRSNIKYGLPHEIVNPKRIKRITNAGLLFMRLKNIKLKKMKIQVVSLIVKNSTVVFQKIIDCS